MFSVSYAEVHSALNNKQYSEDSGTENSFLGWIPPSAQLLQGFGRTRGISALSFIKPQVPLSMCRTSKLGYFKAGGKSCVMLKRLWN